MYLLPFLLFGNGPIISIATFLNGSDTTGTEISGTLLLCGNGLLYRKWCPKGRPSKLVYKQLVVPVAGRDAILKILIVYLLTQYQLVLS
jgi:hypothetical protein